ncbi:MAG: efflux RND transporter periplasmic adaptor subunit [Lutibacter sp.]|nr:efflux RND transporter periplasmic adaptor subunit [Lutibacter sp.]
MTTKTKNIVKMTGILLAGLLLGWIFFGGNDSQKSANENNTEISEETIWTCSMHPQIRMSEPGKCPICGMDLIPLENNHSEADPNALQMSENAMKLANIQTMIVGSKEASKELRLNGKVQIDERKLYAQSTHIPGRIEQLSINFTGEKVNRGQRLAMVYSPELVTAQEELLQAYSIRNSQPELFDAAKQKLRNWKIGDKSINNIISSGKPIQQFPISADVSGIVTAKKVELGDYVERGMPLYEIADLSSVWILFDVYESDIPWVKIGNKVSYTIQSLPGENFEGTISFLDPMINPETRVATARIEVKNAENKLKPEMFVSGIVKNNISKTGNTEIVIPKSAVMWTGERSIVYVKSTSENKVNFKLREVMLGPSLGDAYVIKSGLENGEEIVVNGTFTVDAAAQLAGKPSMMNPENNVVNTKNSQTETATSKAEKTAKTAISSKAKEALKPLYQEYLNLKDALAADHFANAKKAGIAMQTALSKVDMSLFTGESHEIWMKHQNNLKLALQPAPNFKNIEEVRKAFQPVSEAMIALTNSFKPFGQTLYVQHCPMVDGNKGANWLSQFEEIKNPYFGAYMLKCGETKATIK